MANEPRAMLAKIIKTVRNKEIDPISPLIDDYLLRRDTAPLRLITYEVPLVQRKRPPGRLSPSGIGGCIRKSAFSFVGMPGKRQVNLDGELIMEQGTWIHHKWQAIFKDMELVLGSDRFRVIEIEGEVRIPKYFIAGSFDIHIYIQGFGEIIVDKIGR